MASTGAVLYIKPRLGVSVSAGRHSGAVIYIAARFLSGPYSATGVDPSANLTGRRVEKPRSSVPLGRVDPDGRVFINQAWDRYFSHVETVRLGGPLGPTLPDIETTVTVAQSQAATAAASSVGLEQMVTQNAGALAAAVEVAQQAALPGSESIPRVQLSNTIEP